VGQERRTSNVRPASRAGDGGLAAGSSTINQQLAEVAAERAAVLEEADGQTARTAQVRAAALAIEVARCDPRAAVALAEGLTPGHGPARGAIPAGGTADDLFQVLLVFGHVIAWESGVRAGAGRGAPAAFRSRE